MHIELETYFSKLKIRSDSGKKEIFDPVRRQFVALTPEEAVRQVFIQYLHEQFDIPFTLMAVEKATGHSNAAFRFDLAVYNRAGEVRILVECKSYRVDLSEHVSDQLSRYNQKYLSDYLIITNGISTYCWVFVQGTYQAVDNIEKLTLW